MYPKNNLYPQITTFLLQGFVTQSFRRILNPIAFFFIHCGQKEYPISSSIFVMVINV